MSFSALHSVILCVAISTASLVPVLAADQGTQQWLQINWENDIFANEDAGYTNGVGLSWGYKGLDSFDNDEVPTWIGKMASASYLDDNPAKQRALSYGVGQLMFTPADIRESELIPNDRPYAGLLLWAVSLYAFDDQVADRLGLVLGVVGPASGARQAQKMVHRLVGADDPKGWQHQIHNEPVFTLQAGRLWRLQSGRVDGFEFDMIGASGAELGNLSSAVSSGIAVRLGQGLGYTWAASSIIPSRSINVFASEDYPSWQLYLSLSGRYVFNDIALNGNTFKDSHSVEIKHAQALLSTGFAYNRGQWGVSLSYQHGTDQFEAQPVNTRFGSLALTYRFD